MPRFVEYYANNNMNANEAGVFSKANSIDISVIATIQGKLKPYDIISLLFLLEDDSNTLLQHNTSELTCELDLCTWTVRAELQSRPNWKYQLLEALSICQLYNIIKSLGIYVPFAKAYFEPDNLNVVKYIDPMKKALYKLCENMDSNRLLKVKDTLNKNVCGFHIKDSDPCEIVFLKLLYGQFNIFNQLQSDGCVGTSNDAVEVEKPEIEKISALINYLNIEDMLIEDSKLCIKNLEDTYKIKNKNRIGVCCIINQENFHTTNDKFPSLEDRSGSSADATNIAETMKPLKFEIMNGMNFTAENIFRGLKYIIKEKVQSDDTIFMLCILSHGVRDHVFGADSVKVKVEDIQDLLAEAEELRDITKLLIIQACQVDETQPYPLYVLDKPISKNVCGTKSHFLISWATSPSLEAFRVKGYFSIYILKLCQLIRDHSKNLDLYSIFNKLTKTVRSFCEAFQFAQIPRFESTLEKKLYFQVPS